MMKTSNMDPTMSDTISNPSNQAFIEQVRTKFRTSVAGAEDIELELTEIVDHQANPGSECFSLFFRGPTSPMLQQSMRRVEHPGLGAMLLFFTPIALDQEGAMYEVVFNRKKPKS
jgi:hypothetical protein